MERSNRLDLLKRKNAGNRILPELRKKLSLALDISPTDMNFLSLDESDAVQARAAQAFPAKNELETRITNYPFSIKRLGKEERSKKLTSENEGMVFLILAEAERIGVLRLPLATINTHWGKLIEAIPDGWIVLDSEYQNKLVAQTERNEHTSEIVIEIAVWGTAWSN